MPSNSTDHGDPLIAIEADEAPDALAKAHVLAPWRLLVIDDDDEVHRVTRFALRGVEIEGRALELLHAHSAREGEDILRRERDIACILLDVVMEPPDAGLSLVQVIREVIGNTMVRIILRTGQPGQAPELDVVQRYDINDYKQKSELSNTRLLTTLIAACRSYQQLYSIEANRRGLRMIIDATRNLMEETNLKRLSAGVLTQACSILDIPTEGAVCLRKGADDDLRVLAAAGKYHDLSGLKVADISDQAIRDFLVSMFAARKTTACEDGKSSLYTALPSGDEVVVHVDHPHPLPEIEQSLLEVFASNVSVGMRNAELFEQVEKLAYRDRLTNLPNRTSFGNEIRRMIVAGAGFAVAVADLNRFNTVNSGLGHSFGDRMMTEVSRLLSSVSEANGIYVARLHSDVFGLVIPAASVTEAKASLSRVHAVLSGLLDLDEHAVCLSVSIGAAMYPADGDLAQDLYRCADMALRQAKALGLGQTSFYARGMGEILRGRLEMISQLRKAFVARDLRVFFQPQIQLTSGTCVGGEALLRWPLPGGGFISPLEFVTAAEDSGLIHDVGFWVLEETCKWLNRWSASHRRDLRLALNISAIQFRQPGYSERLIDAVAAAGVDPKGLELEITESCLLDDAESIISQLHDFRGKGMRTALDDFGTGYSSLGRLRHLPIDTLKIDRTFVSDICNSTESHNIAETIVRMGHLMSKEVVAEGVETAEQAASLRAIGCEFGQGYLFSPAVPPEEFSRFLT